MSIPIEQVRKRYAASATEDLLRLLPDELTPKA
jgi:hypothetical protein